MEKNIYSGAKVSIRALELVIFLGIAAMVVIIVYLSATGGFDIEFDTAGGSAVATQRIRYGESVVEPIAPTKEGYVFVGWYADEGLTQAVDVANMTVTESTTLYALWEEK